MGLKRLTIRIAGFLFSGAIASACWSASDVIMEEQQWPASRACELCLAVQFGRLEMRLPIEEIGKILVTGSGDSTLHILPKAGNAKKSMVFLPVPPDRLINAYRKAGLLRELDITTNEQLFDALGQLPGEATSLAKIRRIEGIETAARYVKTSKGPVHVYWIQSPDDGGSQRVYFVIDGDDATYMLAGDVTPGFFEAALANLRIANLP